MEYFMEKIKNIPYGIADFEDIIPSNKYYVDKTMYIPIVEKTNFIFLIRPRRFGKSLFLSTLESYYDINKKDRFEDFYKDTWIFSNPTENRAKYMILRFNFSGVIKDKDLVQSDFNNYCVIVINQFLKYYQGFIPEDIIMNINSATFAHEKLHAISASMVNLPVKIYIMIDEYDNFANSLLADYGEGEYQKLTKEAGFFKQFFSNLKLATTGSGSAIARLFITGVSPITMDDVTSGFNVGDNMSLSTELNSIKGFTETEVKEMIDYYFSAYNLDIDKEKALSVMRKWYDNYRFSNKATESVFNTCAVLYFVKEVTRERETPKNPIDDNLRMDYSKLRFLIQQDKKLNGNFNLLSQIIEKGYIESDINKSFPFKMIVKPTNFISLLYFFGMLTFNSVQGGFLTKLSIPNETIRKLMFEYIDDSFEEAFDIQLNMDRFKLLLRDAVVDGIFKPAFEFVAQEIKTSVSLRDSKNENVLKLLYLTYFNITNIFIAASEREMNHGYADLLLIPNKVAFPQCNYAYMIEFKYIKPGEDMTPKIKKAEGQLEQYGNDEHIKKMNGIAPYGDVELKKVVVVFEGWDIVYIEESFIDFNRLNKIN
jgi:hypothetical protein